MVVVYLLQSSYFFLFVLPRFIFTTIIIFISCLTYRECFFIFPNHGAVQCCATCAKTDTRYT